MTEKKNIPRRIRITLVSDIIHIVSTQFRASPFERTLFSALNRVLLIN